MSASSLELRLLGRLRSKGKAALAAGIDLGTTKSCIAYAQYDPATNTLDCRCIDFEQPDGARSVAFPSAVAQAGDRRLYGADALAVRASPGAEAGRDFFYETKNLIGLRYTFKGAPKGLQNPTEVASALVGRLRELSRERVPGQVRKPLVVTVPASFHAAQREATLSAAENAFFRRRNRGAVQLLDEPYAAFVDLKFREPAVAKALLPEGAKVLVFDFGGGTCDVAIFGIDMIHGGTLGARLLATSRYHRLGGGDIDRAIVHDVLIPQLLEQHQIEKWAVPWNTRRGELELQLLAVAERLKIALNMRLAEYHDAGMDVPGDLDVRAVDMQVSCDGQRLTLKQPTLRLGAFKELLVPFLDPEPLPEASDEYVLRNSVFAPIQQALVRANLDRKDLTGVLLCGSSSLLVPVQEAMRAFLPHATQVLLGNPEDLQSAVARGAAIQALSLQVLGKPVVEPVCSAEVSLRLEEGTAIMARAGSVVPSASTAPIVLRPPRACTHGGLELAVEVLSDGKRSAGVSLWHLPAPVSVDERLELSWRMDANQCVELTLTRPGDPRTEPFTKRFDAPIMHRDLGHAVRCRLLEREERFRTNAIPDSRLGQEYEDHARDCASVGEYEKALHYVSLAMQEQGSTPNLMLQRGIWQEQIGDKDGARNSYERAGANSAARFDLGLLHYRAKRDAEALVCVDEAIAMESDDRAYHVLRGNILKRLGQAEAARTEWQDAIDGHLDVQTMSEFTLGWLESAARSLDNTELVERIREQRHQFSVQAKAPRREGDLPARYDVQPTLAL